MTNDPMVTITLPSNDLGQILDGLRQRFSDWQNTADAFTEDGDYYSDDDSFVMQECSGKDEAQKIADTYKRLIEAIESQVLAQAVAVLNG